MNINSIHFENECNEMNSSITNTNKKLLQSTSMLFFVEIVKISENVNSNVCIAHSKDVSSYG